MNFNPARLVLLTSAVIILLIGAFFFLKPTTKPDLPKTAKIDIANHPQLGDPQKKTQIVVFEDLKCVNCKAFNKILFPQIKRQYLDTGKANYTFILLAFIPGSIPAGNAALCLHEQNPKYFFPFVEYLFDHQPPEEEDWATIPALLDFAKKATPEANSKALEQCIFLNKYSAQLQKNLDLAARLMKGSIATPTVYVNGVQVNPLSMKKINQLIP
jgi:protein-disulfide isomerase